ncbi:MAG: NAD-dependent epimerase/dehydratase family protein [Streptosporangiaceae bacterium]
MQLLVTGGTGVLGRAFLPWAEAEGHRVTAPGRAELDLFDPAAVAGQLCGVDAVLHLATRIQPLEKTGQPQAWRQNDRLRAEDAGRALLAALTVPSGIYNVCRDGERVSNRRFAAAAGWRPRH